MPNETVTTNQKTFSIFLQDGRKKPGLRRSFLRELTILQGDKTIILEDDSEFDLYLEPSAYNALKRDGAAYCIVSFQVFDNEAIAVARTYVSPPAADLNLKK